ncbi:hypothetical protein B0A55_04768 [Friedmanniomyces simplex]|uniref:SEC7 domain-containing protein n=1 Tax=Friedmanniomyces simplex TaxID=329884 RepID=A0A4U0XMA3_9PEZI|nr:hypothetical protein B0A55_04768 [Friedmanniomyces simplex]
MPAGSTVVLEVLSGAGVLSGTAALVYVVVHNHRERVYDFYARAGGRRQHGSAAEATVSRRADVEQAIEMHNIPRVRAEDVGASRARVARIRVMSAEQEGSMRCEPCHNCPHYREGYHAPNTHMRRVEPFETPMVPLVPPGLSCFDACADRPALLFARSDDYVPYGPGAGGARALSGPNILLAFNKSGPFPGRPSILRLERDSPAEAHVIAACRRADVSPSIAERTSSRNALNTTYLDGVGGLPSTPIPRKRRAKNKGKEPVGGSGSRREQVKRGHSDHNRHSHGLSWSSTTRDSVVDNLLMSLGNLSNSHLDSDMDMDTLRERQAEREKYGVPQMPQLPHFPATRPMQRARGHTYSSSLSSGFDGYGNGVAPGSPASKYSSSTKGRRSNSSSNFGTVSSRSQTTRRANGPTRVSSDTQRRVGDTSLVKSAGSDIDSLDHGYGSVLETNRLNWGGRRSMSMDQIFREPSLTGSSVLDRGRPVPSVHSKFEGNYDAAPEPGVPAGPRKKLNPSATGPVYVNQAPSKQSIRKVNTQSDLRTASKPCPPIPQYIQEQAIEFVRNNSMQGMPSMPHPHEHSAPAPSPGFKTARKDAPSPSRERPGFFKRVFGSASRTPSGLSSDSQEAFGYGDRAIMPDARSRSQASNDTVPARPETRKTSREQSISSHPPPALNKKPSSFFRRRKKSNTENMPPPPLPNTGLNFNVKSAQPSPSVSSLRKVMDPYLALEGTPLHSPLMPRDDSSRPTTQESTTADSDELDMFHSGYTPPPDASLGWRDPLRRDATTMPKISHEQQSSPRMKIKVKKRQTDAVLPETQQPQNLAESSFLHDASREASSATLGDHFRAPAEEPTVSPVLESPPAMDRRETDLSRPISRASTGDMILASQPNSPVDARKEVRNFSAGTDVSVEPSDDDDGFIVMHSPSVKAAESLDLKRPERLFLKPTELEEKRQNGGEALSPLGSSRNGSMSTALQSPAMYTATSSIAQSPGISSVYHSTTSLPLPSVQIDGIPRKSGDTQHTRDTSAVFVDDGAEYRERARKIYDGDEEDVTKGEAASWLGEGNTLSRKTLQAYMQLFDFSGMNFLSALRMLCGRILLRGETQQFDRIVAALTERWCECNPNNGFKAHDVVHTVLYSLILLNTDLHVAMDNEKMSRNAYVKNTIPSLRRLAQEAVPNAFDETMKPSSNASRPALLPWAENGASAPGAEAPGSPSFPPDTPRERTSLELPKPNASKRLSLRPGMFKSDSDGLTPDSATGNASNALVNQSWTGNLRGWEGELETVLKSFWTSIRTDPLPLLGAPTVEFASGDRSLSVANLGGLKRSGSVVSKAPSDNMSFRSKPGFRAITMGWQNRNNRSRPKLYPASTVASSRTSFDDNNSMWSPAQSSSWSKNSFAKTLTSASMNSLGYHLSPTAADYKHSIGFANALSQAIIREEGGTGDTDSVTIPGGLLEDEGLALEGAPWAKEGLVKHKHHLETVDRKAKERSWSDCFAVISKGKLTLFAFGTANKSHSMGRKNQTKQAGGRAASLAATKVGGGDWMENAEQLDTFVLRHTIASTLPPPGYSKARPHVWALSLPSGAVHLFQVGTPEIALEFMSSANYWSARLSKEPLSGSVSNVEYGWSEQVINIALVEPRSASFAAAASPPLPPSSLTNPRGHLHSVSSASGPIPRPSFQSSLRGSFDTGFGGVGGGGGGAARNRLPGDKAHVTDWQPPSQSMMASQLLEVDQLRALTGYVGHVEVELERHNELKHAIELAYSPRHANHHRSMANWQRKSDYLLREIVKFRTYMDSLAAAQKAKERFYAKRSEQHQQHVETASLNRQVAASSPVDSGRAMKEEREGTLRGVPAPLLQSAG